MATIQDTGGSASITHPYKSLFRIQGVNYRANGDCILSYVIIVWQHQQPWLPEYNRDSSIHAAFREDLHGGQEHYLRGLKTWVTSGELNSMHILSCLINPRWPGQNGSRRWNTEHPPFLCLAVHRPAAESILL